MQRENKSVRPGCQRVPIAPGSRCSDDWRNRTGGNPNTLRRKQYTIHDIRNHVVHPNKSVTHVSLCHGYGGFSLSLAQIFGRNLVELCHCEVEAYPIAHSLNKSEESGIDREVPCYSDVRSFPFGQFHGMVRILSFGIPCQGFSLSGKQAADADPRHLWPYVRDGISRMQPDIILFENVEGIVTSKLKGKGWIDPEGTPVLLHVLREMERLRYRVAPGIFSAEECGAPQRRKRVFILGYRDGFDFGGWIKRAMEDAQSVTGRIYPGPWSDGGTVDSGRTGEMAHSSSNGQRSRKSSKSKEPSRGVLAETTGGEIELAKSESERCGEGQSEPGLRERRTGIGWTGNEIELGNSTGNDQCGTSNGAHGQGKSIGRSGELADTTRLRERESNDKECSISREDSREDLGRGSSQSDLDRPDELANSDRQGRQGRQGEPSDHGPEQPAVERSGCDGPIFWPGFVSRPGEPQHDWEPYRVTLPTSLFNLWNRIRKNAPASLREKIAQREETEGFISTLLKMGVRFDGRTRFLDCDTNTDELRLLGNGIYPAAAVKAFLNLAEKLLEH